MKRGKPIYLVSVAARIVLSRRELVRYHRKVYHIFRERKKRIHECTYNVFFIYGNINI